MNSQQESARGGMGVSPRRLRHRQGPQCTVYGSPREVGGEAHLGHHSAVDRPRCGAPGASPPPPTAAPGDIMPEVWPRQSGGGYTEYSAGTTVHARVKVVSLLVPGWRLLSQACSSIFATAQDGPSSERARASILMSCYSRVVRPCGHWCRLPRWQAS